MSLEYRQDDASDLDTTEAQSRQRPPIPVYTTTVIIALGIVFLAQLAEGLDRSILRAGFVKQAFLHDREYWRILTGATTHASIMHVLMNCYAFYSFGRIFEMLTNRAHLAIVFLLSAIGGGILTLLLQPEGISVGASGGIVGLVSYLAVYSFKRRRFITPEFRRSLLTNIGFILIFGLVLYQVVDNWGHIGGLLTGAIYGLVQIPSNEYSDPRKASLAVEYAGVAALGIFLAACAFSVAVIIHLV